MVACVFAAAAAWSSSDCISGFCVMISADSEEDERTLKPEVTYLLRTSSRAWWEKGFWRTSEYRHQLQVTGSLRTSMFWGIAIRNLVPLHEEFTVIIPLWLSTILLTIGSPRPHPSRLVENIGSKIRANRSS